VVVSPIVMIMIDGMFHSMVHIVVQIGVGIYIMIMCCYTRRIDYDVEHSCHER
jgi:hypothetical protein